MVSWTEYEMTLEKPPKRHLGAVTNISCQKFPALCEEPSTALEISNSFSVFQHVAPLPSTPYIPSVYMPVDRL